MKYLLLIALALLALWWWRSLAGRGTERSQAPKQPPAPPPPQDMIACRHCGVHLPGADAIAGGKGSYCSAAHRQAAEGQ